MKVHDHLGWRNIVGLDLVDVWNILNKLGQIRNRRLRNLLQVVTVRIRTLRKFVAKILHNLSLNY